MYGCFGWFAFRAPDFPAPFAVDFSGASHVFTDADGRRFADETGYEVHDRLRALLTYLPRNPNRPRLPSWAVFDDAARRAGPLNGLLGTPNDYAWSPARCSMTATSWAPTPPTTCARTSSSTCARTWMICGCRGPPSPRHITCRPARSSVTTCTRFGCVPK